MKKSRKDRKTKREKERKTKKTKDKRQRPKREFYIVTSGQFRTLAMFPARDRLSENPKGG